MFNETDIHLSNLYWNINTVLVRSSGWLVNNDISHKIQVKALGIEGQ